IFFVAQGFAALARPAGLREPTPRFKPAARDHTRSRKQTPSRANVLPNDRTETRRLPCCSSKRCPGRNHGTLRAASIFAEQSQAKQRKSNKRGSPARHVRSGASALEGAARGADGGAGRGR